MRPWTRVAQKAIEQRQLLVELIRHGPNAAQHMDDVEVSTPLSCETLAKRGRGAFVGVESSPQRYEKAWLRPATAISGSS